jgi:ring-1,2-phenylacetyl-CoA epoxidase subunit PaaE
VPARQTFHPLPVASIERLCADAAAVRFAVPTQWASTYEFRPGQSLTLRRIVDGRDERRSYSICAAAGTSLRIGVREVPGGLFSRWLVHDLRVGDLVEVAPPTGGFTPDPVKPAHHVLIGAGSGITPLLSIAASVLTNSDSRVTLLYGNRRVSTVMFADELADLKDRYPTRLELVHLLSRELRDAELFSGRLDADRLRRLLPLLLPVSDVDHWWLCGPFGLVTDAQSVLAELEVPRSLVHQELFYVGDVPPEPARHEDPAVTGPHSNVTVRLDGRSSTVPVPGGSTILDAVGKVRPDLPFACKGGICGTCRARLVDGAVAMRRNFALDESEVDAGFVLTCQSMPTTDAVTVDYDA